MAQETILVLILAGILSSISGAPITLEQLYQLRSECPAYPVFLPHPTDCNEYFVCDYGRPIAMSCPPGLHFSPIYRVCDYPYRAKCKVSGFKSVTSSRGSLDVVGNQRQSVMRKDVRCPPKNREVLYFLPHEVNCNEYYVCDNGWSVWMTCPGALHFNTKKNICDYPQNVQCKSEAPEHAPAGPVARSAGVEEDESPKPDSNLQMSPGKRDVRCPLRNGAMPVFLAHETNCASYYVCDSGLAILMSCPHHLLFNKDINVCDQPQKVDCSDHPQQPRSAESSALQAPAGPVARSAAVEDDESPKPDNNLQMSPGKRDVRCPLRNGAMPVFLAHETNCASYYVCDSGLAILMSCPHHLLFNKDINVCDQPQKVDCSDHPQQPRSAEPTALQAPLGPAAAPPASMERESSSFQASPGKRDVRCPLRNGAMPVFLSHESICASYYVCDSGLAILMSCPHHLLFNKDKNVCDQPENVQCDNQEKEERSAEPAVPEGLEAPMAIKKDPRCPRWNPVTPVFLSHETECGKYYICDWGYAFLMHCPTSLGFNPETNICSLSKPC